MCSLQFMIFSTQRRRDAEAQRKTRGFLSFISAPLYFLVSGLKKSQILILLSFLLWFLSANTKKIFLFFSASLRLCVSALKKSHTVKLTESVLFFLLVCFGFLHGELPVEVSFFDLPKLEQQHEKEIRIRGFLYETTSKELILSSKPDLKSCCIDQFPKIYVHDFQSKGVQKVVTIEGKLFVSKEIEILKYELQNARMAVENKSQTLNLALFMLGCAIALIFYIFYRSTKECTAKA